MSTYSSAEMNMNLPLEKNLVLSTQQCPYGQLACVVGSPMQVTEYDKISENYINHVFPFSHHSSPYIPSEQGRFPKGFAFNWQYNTKAPLKEYPFEIFAAQLLSRACLREEVPEEDPLPICCPWKNQILCFPPVSKRLIMWTVSLFPWQSHLL